MNPYSLHLLTVVSLLGATWEPHKVRGKWEISAPQSASCSRRLVWAQLQRNYHGLFSKLNILNSVKILTLKFKPPRKISKSENVALNVFIILLKKKNHTKLWSANSLTSGLECVSFVIRKPQNGLVKNNVQILYKSHNILEVSLKITHNIHIFTELFHSIRKQGAFRVILFVII